MMENKAEIRFISSEEVLPVRSLVLRDGKSFEFCRFETDIIDGAFHLGYYLDQQLVCVTSFHPEGKNDFKGKGYQLRGMATLISYQGKSIGNQLVNFAIIYLRGLKANYVWCNARKKAYRFYENLGFEFISEEFEVPEIGPHKAMYLKIQ